MGDTFVILSKVLPVLIGLTFLWSSLCKDMNCYVFETILCIGLSGKDTSAWKPLLSA